MLVDPEYARGIISSAAQCATKKDMNEHIS